MVPADSHKASPTSRYSGYHYPSITYVYVAVTRYGQVSHPVLLHFTIHVVVLQPQLCRNIAGLGSFPFARHYSGNHYYFLFLRVLRCFSSPGLLPFNRVIPLHGTGLPHSEICGSPRMCQSPQLIAAYHVFHRL